VNLFSDRYTAGHSLLHATVNSNNSSMWSSIIRAKNILKNDFVWRAGSGLSSFWFSCWNDFGFLGSLVPVIDIHDIHLTIKDVLTFNGHRSLFLYTTLPQAVVNFVNNTNIRFKDEVDDAFVWPLNKNGVYSTKIGFKWLLSLSGSDTAINSSFSWSWIWHLKIPEKYKFLIWLACHKAIPTLSLLHHRNIASSSICCESDSKLKKLRFLETINSGPEFECCFLSWFGKNRWPNGGI